DQFHITGIAPVILPVNPWVGHNNLSNHQFDAGRSKNFHSTRFSGLVRYTATDSLSNHAGCKMPLSSAPNRGKRTLERVDHAFARLREESVMPFTKYSSIFTPDDLEILQKVFDKLCTERRLALKDGDQRERLALEVMDAFQNGFTDDVELWRLFSKRRTAIA
ncbi:hypothetical protein, partial [Neomesorhizobium albiziae]